MAKKTNVKKNLKKAIVKKKTKKIIAKKSIAKKSAPKSVKKSVKKPIKKIAKKTIKKSIVLKAVKKSIKTPIVKSPLKKGAEKQTTKRTVLTPLGDKIVVRLINQDKVTSGGLIIPGTVQSADAFSKGTVLNIGAGLKNKKGNIRPLDVKQGDTVLFKVYSATQVEIDSEKLYILNESDVFGIV